MPRAAPLGHAAAPTPQPAACTRQAGDVRPPVSTLPSHLEVWVGRTHTRLVTKLTFCSQGASLGVPWTPGMRSSPPTLTQGRPQATCAEPKPAPGSHRPHSSAQQTCSQWLLPDNTENTSVPRERSPQQRCSKRYHGSNLWGGPRV